MAKQLPYSLSVILLCVVVFNAQQPADAPFAALDKAFRQETGSLNGDKSRCIGNGNGPDRV